MWRHSIELNNITDMFITPIISVSVLLRISMFFTRSLGFVIPIVVLIQLTRVIRDVIYLYWLLTDLDTNTTAIKLT